MVEVAVILAERATTHGDYSDHAAITQSIKRRMHIAPKWQKLTDCESEALEMIAHKIGRILAGDPHFRDHWDDIAGYATLVAERSSE